MARQMAYKASGMTNTAGGAATSKSFRVFLGISKKVFSGFKRAKRIIFLKIAHIGYYPKKENKIIFLPSWGGLDHKMNHYLDFPY